MKAAQIAAILNQYVPHPQMPLLYSDPFTLLIAVLISAQCTDERVNQVTPKLFALASTPQKMAQLSPKKVEAIIRPCGLAPTKSRAIVQLSKDLIAHHKGRVPRTFEELEQLPGVGHKTASVVLAHAFDIPAFPVDTHIHRCAKRWGLSSGKSVEETERDLKRLFPEKSWIKIHLQMTLFARKFCPARGHKIADCPICSKM